MRGFFASSSVQHEKPTGRSPKCGACGLYKRCNSPKMEPYGDGRKKVLIVGEAPGQTEDEHGRPFIGKAGQHLRDALDELGIDLDEDALTTNSLICHPPQNATPDAKQVAYCRPNLVNTLQDFQPRVVIALGRAALDAVLQPYWKEIRALERWVGWTIPIERHWICPTFHPSYLLRMNNPMMHKRWLAHLEEAFAIKDNPPKQPDWEGRIEVLYDENEICDALETFDREDDWVAVDYETNCLKPDWDEAKIYSCAVAGRTRCISYPWRGDAITVTGDILRSKRTRKIASNLKMEERWTLKEFGHGVRNWGWDTMLAAHCLDNRPGICSLKFQMFVNLGVPSYNERIEPYLFSFRGHFNRIQEIEMGQLLTYGGMDAMGEYVLAAIQRTEMGY